MTTRSSSGPSDDEADAIRRENARLRERASEAERRLQRVEIELREIKQSGALRIGRFLSRLLPGRLKHRLYDPFRRAEPLASAERPGPGPTLLEAEPSGPVRFSIVVPVYDHARHLPAMIDSLLAQTRPADEILLVDDASPDPAVQDILRRYDGRQGVRVLRNASNLGISATTNRGIQAAVGSHLAFVDSDDLLEPDALERVEAFLSAHPGVDFLYTDRVDIDEQGHELQRWDFTERAARPPLPELLEGMFTSHLKVVSAAALRDVGLFRPRYDLTQDYDLALRLAERRRLGHLPTAVYRHRLHGGQQSQQQQRRQEELLERIRRDSLRRTRLRSSTDAPLVSIVLEDPTGVRHASAPSPLTVLEGRLELAAGREPRGGYVLRMQHGVVLSDPALVVKMVERLEHAPELSACCALVTDGDRIVSNGGRFLERDGFLSFVLDGQGDPATGLAMLAERRCDWVPPGAVLWRRTAHDTHREREELVGGLRAQELGLRLRAPGIEVGTCPTARVQWRAPLPVDEPARILASLRAIFRAHGVVVRDDALYRAMGWDLRDLDAARARITQPG